MKPHRKANFLFGAQQKFNFQPLNFLPRRSSAFGHALLSLPRVIFEFTKTVSSGDLRTVFHASQSRIDRIQKLMFTFHRGHLSYHSLFMTSFDQGMCLVYQERVFLSRLK